jgi:hypothetical protein
LKNSLSSSSAFFHHIQSLQQHSHPVHKVPHQWSLFHHYNHQERECLQESIKREKEKNKKRKREESNEEMVDEVEEMDVMDVKLDKEKIE